MSSFNGEIQRLGYDDDYGADQSIGYDGLGVRSQGRYMQEPTARGRVLRLDAGYGGHGMSLHEDEYDGGEYEQQSRIDLRRDADILYGQDAHGLRPAGVQRAVRQPESLGPMLRRDILRTLLHDIRPLIFHTSAVIPVNTY